MTMTIEFDRPGISGYRLVDFFEGVHWLEDGDTFVGRVNITSRITISRLTGFASPIAAGTPMVLALWLTVRFCDA